MYRHQVVAEQAVFRGGTALQRLLRDLDDEKRMAAQRARIYPWRTP